MLRNPRDCQHERLEGDVDGSRFDDHRTTRGLCPDCGQYTIATDFADGRHESRKMTQAEIDAWVKAVWHDVGCWECETDFGDTHRDECGDTCTRAPGSDRCLQCLNREAEMEYYRGLYEVGALGPRRRDYDNAEEFDDAVRAWGLRP